MLDNAPAVTPVKGRALLPIWVTVQLPRETKAGTCTGEVTVLLDGDKKTKLGDELAKRCQVALDAHQRAMWKTQWSNDEDLNSLGTLGDSGGFILNGVPQYGIWNVLQKDAQKLAERHPGLKGQSPHNASDYRNESVQ